MEVEFVVDEAYLIKDIEALFDDLGEKAESYGWIVDDNGGDTDGPDYIIPVEDVDEQDRDTFEKHSRKVTAAILYGYNDVLRDFLRWLVEDFDRKFRWWGSQSLEKAVFYRICRKKTTGFNW